MPRPHLGSGDVWPIPWVSLTLITFWREILSADLIAENIICSTTREILSKFSMTIQHFVLSCQPCTQQAMNF